MKFRKLIPAAALFAALFHAAPCGAATVVSVTGNSGSSNFADNNYVLATSWSLSQSFTGVSISGYFGGPATATAYLMRDVGPGITVSSQVASVEFTPTNFGGGTVVLFNGLNLTAGNYYLVVVTRDAFGVSWSMGTNSTVDGNAALKPSITAYGIASYAPASTFSGTASGQYVYSVTGTAVVPEPASMALALSGMTLLACRRTRRVA